MSRGLTRLLAAAIATLLSGASALAQTPPVTSAFSPGAADLQQACHAQAEAAATWVAGAPDGHVREQIMASMDRLYETVAARPKDQVTADLAKAEAQAGDAIPPQLRELEFCLLRRRLAQS